MIAHDGPSEGFEPRSEWTSEHGKLAARARRALKQPEVVVVEDLSCVRAKGTVGALRGGSGTGAMMVRLEYDGNRYGLLVVSASKRLVEDARERTFFNDIANALAFTLWSFEQKRARGRMEAACRQLRREIGMGRRITETFLAWPGDGVYREVLGILLDATESKRGVFGYIDENGSYVVPSITPQGPNESHLESGARVFPEDAWGDTAGARAIKEKRTICSNRHPTFSPRADVAIHRCVSVPVIHQGTVMGLLQVANKGSDYDEKDIESLKTAAAFIAPFLAVRLRQERPEIVRNQERTAHSAPAGEPMQNAPPEPLTKVPEETLVHENEHEIGEGAGHSLRSPRKIMRGAASLCLDASRAIASFVRAHKPLEEAGRASLPRRPRYVLLISGNPATVESVNSALHPVADVGIVGVASSREEGLAMAQNLSPDVIIVDLSSVGMSGLHSIYDLRQEFPWVGIVATCQWATATLKRSALESGADRFILISRLDKDLLRAVRDWISSTISGTRYLIRAPHGDTAHKGRMN